MLLRLVQYSKTIDEIDDFRKFGQVLIELHECLEKTCEDNRFQIEFFTNTVVVQEILKEFVSNSMKNESNVFFDEVLSELNSNSSKYSSLIVVLRLIEVVELILTKEKFNEISLHWIDRSISSLCNLIDQCQIQLVLPALLPTIFGKTQVEYGSVYDVSSNLLVKLLKVQPIQTSICLMTRFVERSKVGSSIFSSSMQISAEIIIQSVYFYEKTNRSFREILSLFIVELIRSNRYEKFLQHLLAIVTDKSIKNRVYQMFLSNDRFQGKKRKQFVDASRLSMFKFDQSRRTSFDVREN